MIEYLIQDKKYSLSYKELKEEYLKNVFYTDEEFIENLPSAIHLACIICWFKETPTDNCLNDKGIIHELAHLLHIGKEPNVDIQEIRELFKTQLELV